MKQFFFLFAMLAGIAASATVTVTPISADYATKRVTFKVAWSGTPYNNRVWVWVDFCPINGTTPATSFSTATVSNPAKTAGNGTITGATARGFFIEYSSATNSGTTITAILSNAPVGKFNWCAYGSDYPPNVLANTNGSYTLAGTPPFKLIATNATTKTVDEKTIAISAVTMTPATITDATGYPGLWCPYTGSDLIMDATHRCMQRQSGACNWEAYIKDSRDGTIYHITQFSDNTWWFADDLAITENTFGICNGIHFYTGSNRPACPTGWIIPTAEQFLNRWANYCATSVEVDDNYGAPIDATCYYGSLCGGSSNACRDCFYRRDYVTSNYVGTLIHGNPGGGCNWNCDEMNKQKGIGGRVRCSR